MANNRMQLVCGECGERITLCASWFSRVLCLRAFGSYYPKTGWYTFGPTVEKPEYGRAGLPRGESRLTDWLAAHVHGYEGAMFGPCYFRLVYEVCGL